MMYNIRLTVEFKGTRYTGWQNQKNGSSIQEILETALATIVGKHTHLAGAGRTDAGVHALNYTANFHTAHLHPLTAYTHGINSLIPPDIVVKVAEVVDIAFHAQRSATAKHYRFTFLLAPFASPLIDDFVWHLPYRHDIATMKEAAARLVGEIDLRAFTAAPGLAKAKTTVRTIYESRLTVHRPTSSSLGKLVEFDIIGSGFLHNNVRAIAGTLSYVGQGKLTVDDLGRIIASGDRTLAGMTAPAKGLSFVEAIY